MDEEAPDTRLGHWQTARIQAFVDLGSGFRHLLKPYLALVALRAADQNVIVSARLTFSSPTAPLIEKGFESHSVRARAFPLPSLAAAEVVISEFASGLVRVGDERFSFPSEDGSQIKIDVEPFHQGAGAQTRLPVLTMHGRTTTGLLDNQRLDWEVKAASPPYLSFQELLLDYGVPVPQGFGTFETFHALPIIVDNARSRLNGNIASIALKVERGIEPTDVQLGVIAIKTGEAAHRQTIPGGSLKWEDDGQFSVGTVECEVPAGRTIQAIASLRGTAFHYWWIVDPLQIPNTRKAVYQVVDSDFAILRDFMVAGGPKGSARDLEAAVAWLLWILGFSVAHLGANTRTQDAVDILATTPNGHFALVECTTGVISTDKKVANLLSRRAVVLERLARASQNQVRVLPVIVTSKSREEVAQEIGPTQQRGVLALTRDDLVEMLNRTDMLPDADQLYVEAERQLAGSVETQPTLPGVQ
jgi:hypothetical protein